MTSPRVIEMEKAGFCVFCGKHAETRPYGEGGREICFKCAMKPERKATTEKNFRIFHEIDDGK